MSHIALLFPGQGSQVVGMGKEFWNEFDVAKQLFEEASEAISCNLKKLCFEGSMNDLTLTMNAQPALLTVSVIAFQVYMQEIGVKPIYMAGHSLGEYSALVCAGVLPFRDAIKLVRQRGIIMNNADPHQQGTMVAMSHIKLEALQKICEEISTKERPACVACMNADQQFVISGHRQTIQEMINRTESLGTKHSYLNVSGPYHSPMMNMAGKRFKVELDQTKYSQAKYPVISNVTATPYHPDHSVVDYLNMQMTMPVRWLESMHYLIEQGVTEVIELGSKNVLVSLMNKITKRIVPYSLNQPSDLLILTNTHERKNKLLTIRKNMLSNLMVTALISRNYNQDSISYAKRVEPLFLKLQRLKEQVDNNGYELSEEDLNHSIQLCHSILSAKQIPNGTTLIDVI
ncbi:ACP S-malonyltransferase [Paenibacillus sp. OK003]|uniref:ACP S-malonyltransferase n=1 Tax=Paenibacillus sp. OK003 TaxID=1884380 RepID=UPI0008C4282C|nr:ACP S-malonyltransferase [Paenibacillus sp. OK003]SEL41056.1 [acyl-carrier-protein] S-malonyltransferase [Paenibacillus sp. OK003]